MGTEAFYGYLRHLLPPSWKNKLKIMPVKYVNHKCENNPWHAMKIINYSENTVSDLIQV